MAYIKKEDTQKARKIVNTIGKKYNFKFSTSMKDYSTLNVALMKGPNLFEFFKPGPLTKKIIKDYSYNLSHDEFKSIFPLYLTNADYPNTLKFWDRYRAFKSLQEGYLYYIPSIIQGDLKKCLEEIKTAVNKALGYYNNSDVQTDYFDVAFYFNITIGKHNKNYTIIA